MSEKTDAELAIEKKPEEVVHDLDYYLAHPDEMPTDTKSIEELFAAHEVKEAAKGEKKPPEEEKPKPEDKPAAKADEQPAIDGVLTKDGKHVIPYAEMERRINEATGSQEAEAVARKAAEDYAKTLEQNIRNLNARIDAGEFAKAADEPVSMELPKELMDTLESEFPTIAKAIKAQQALFKHAENKMAALEKRVGGAEKERTADVASEVESFISQVPDLVNWRKNTPYLFARAQEVEEEILKDKEFLKANPELKDNDVARYAEVVKRVKQEVGLPAASPEKDDKDLEKKAAEIVDNTKTTLPRSLSDLPPGKTAAHSETESLENLSAVDIGARFMGMTPEKIQEQLSRL